MQRLHEVCSVLFMNYITGTNRHQSYFATLEDQLAPDNAVRLIDAFVDKLELAKLCFSVTVLKSEGRPLTSLQFY